ncbi:MAG: hypothetical protein HYR64_01440 [Fimbriimonas ginsengisoli]|uniref:Uncharacterized protein n=1 Tax=Fimbriimonas ginsengisoli TaxID=1005039 RepID=A0A931LT87_FIMGI|nr:hypothetical protein [Fimbriimonas ginsengisoli]
MRKLIGLLFAGILVSVMFGCSGGDQGAAAPEPGGAPKGAMKNEPKTDAAPPAPAAEAPKAEAPKGDAKMPAPKGK